MTSKTVNETQNYLCESIILIIIYGYMVLSLLIKITSVTDLLKVQIETIPFLIVTILSILLIKISVYNPPSQDRLYIKNDVEIKITIVTCLLVIIIINNYLLIKIIINLLGGNCINNWAIIELELKRLATFFFSVMSAFLTVSLSLVWKKKEESAHFNNYQNAINQIQLEIMQEGLSLKEKKISLKKIEEFRLFNLLESLFNLIKHNLLLDIYKDMHQQDKKKAILKNIFSPERNINQIIKTDSPLTVEEGVKKIFNSLKTTYFQLKAEESKNNLRENFHLITHNNMSPVDIFLKNGNKNLLADEFVTLIKYYKQELSNKNFNDINKNCWFYKKSIINRIHYDLEISVELVPNQNPKNQSYLIVINLKSIKLDDNCVKTITNTKKIFID